jgi:hypothetical protein
VIYLAAALAVALAWGGVSLYGQRAHLRQWLEQMNSPQNKQARELRRARRLLRRISRDLERAPADDERNSIKVFKRRNT